jgi:hypothetical protein
MPYIEPEVVLQAKQIDLLSYLQACEPSNLVGCPETPFAQGT